jgi:hypothetical protein
MIGARAMHDRQKAADLVHHRANVAWLEQPCPAWADGSPVGKATAADLLRRNQAAIVLIERHGMSTGGSGDAASAIDGAS